MSITISSELPIKSKEIITSIGQQNFIRTADNIRLEEYEINAGVIVKYVDYSVLVALLGMRKSLNLEIPLNSPSLDLHKPLLVLNNQFNVELSSKRDDIGFIPTTYKFILNNSEFKILDNVLLIYFNKNDKDTGKNATDNTNFFIKNLIIPYKKLNTNAYFKNMLLFILDCQIQMRISFTLFYMEKKIIW